MITKIEPAMISTGSQPVGAIAQVTSEGLLSITEPSATVGDAPNGMTAAFDRSTGILSLSFANGSSVNVKGFPTIDDIKSGATGKQGIRGLTGRAGTNGRDGKDGEKGCAGRKGDRGRQGATGPTGPVGNTGPTGSTGPEGNTGPTGPRGKDSLTDRYTAIPLIDPLSGEAFINAYIGSIEDQNASHITNMGRAVFDKTRDTVQVSFNTPFKNRCVSLSITFLDQTTNQAKTYKIYDTNLSDGSWENFLKGGFVLKSLGENLKDWDFFYTAIGD